MLLGIVVWSVLLSAALIGGDVAVAAVKADLSRVVFIINSQPTEGHLAPAEYIREMIKADLAKAGISEPLHVYSVADPADGLPLHGAWTYFPVLRALAEKFTGTNDVADWFVFLEENAVVDVGLLAEVLGAFHADDDIFLGSAIADSDHVVIHHYEKPNEIDYPLADAGFVLSRAVVKRVARDFQNLMHGESTKAPKDFSIDSQYELAKTLKHLPDGKDILPVLLRSDTRFCHQPEVMGKCAISPEPATGFYAFEDEVRTQASKTLIAVKTCEQFHAERLPVVRDTWGSAAPNVKYFSDVEDPAYDTVVLPGVRNTERGHCGKTFAILKYFHANAKKEGWEWLVIADDDTILGVNNLMQVLSAYDSAETIGTY